MLFFEKQPLTQKITCYVHEYAMPARRANPTFRILENVKSLFVCLFVVCLGYGLLDCFVETPIDEKHNKFDFSRYPPPNFLLEWG